MPEAPVNALELYCGIGGCASVLSRAGFPVVGAVDINRPALGVYRHNFPHPTFAKSIDSLGARQLASFGAELWWASPPCQPFTRRGRQRDLDDPRARTFLALLKHLGAVRPRCFAMENVVGFEASEARDRLMDCLNEAGYRSIHEYRVCPSELGIPNRRPRYYALASLDRIEPSPPPAESPTVATGRLVDWIGPDVMEAADGIQEMVLNPEIVRRYRGAIHIVDRNDSAVVTRCFTSAYGRSHVRSGSFVIGPSGPRRFSPLEILRLLGFPADFRLPADLPLKNAWRLVGNSLALEAVRFVLSDLYPSLAEPFATQIS